MSDTQQQQPSTAWQQQLFGVARVQVLAALIASVFALFWQGGVIAISILSGGILVGLNSVLLARSVVSSSQVEGADGRGVLYRSAALRFLLLILVLTGASQIGVHLLAMAAGMFTAYVGGYIYIVRVTSRIAGRGRNV
ncbi:MAG: ATP synthase subunit I [Mariprofundaceae bacterium]|nr:ATP synthase subunit I [Mariprofundaceae bacterium]